MEVTDHLTCLLRNLYAGQKATVRNRHGTMNWFKIGKGVHKGYILSPCLFSLDAEYMWNARLDEAQAGIKITRRNINNLRYADITTLMTESKKELKNLLKRVREKSGKAGLKHSKNEDRGIQSHYFMANRWEKVERVTDFIFLGSKINSDYGCKHVINRCLLLWRKVTTNLDIILRSRDITANKGLYS